MKKLFILSFLTVCIYCNADAQIKMDSNGNFSIASTPSPCNNAKLVIDFTTTYHNNFCNYAFSVTNTPPTSDGRYNYGNCGTSYFSSAQTISQNYGIFGQAGNATTGYNYGVYGKLIGSLNGAAIFGAMQGRSVANTSGNWAGFFNGNVKITDALTVNTTVYNSDLSLKKNVTPLTNSTFNKIYQLNPVSYLFKTKQELKAEGIIPTDTSTINETENIYISKTHYGLIAQEVRQLLPELVYEGADSILGIDYIGFIPLIIETIKQQNSKIEELEIQLNICCKSSSIESDLKMSADNNDNKNDNLNARLYQNKPNPFTSETRIGCYVPENTQTAFVFIYNMQGTQLRKILINRKGETSININGNELTAGMYLYTLIIDGKEIDTKRMVLTD